MKKEKTVRTYQRRTKTGKVVTVKQHTAKYDAAEMLKEAAKKKGAGDELEALKKKPQINPAKDVEPKDDALGFTADEFKQWYHWDTESDPKNKAAKKVEKALKEKLGAKGYKKYYDEMTDSYSARGHNKAFKEISLNTDDPRETAAKMSKYESKTPTKKTNEDSAIRQYAKDEDIPLKTAYAEWKSMPSTEKAQIKRNQAAWDSKQQKQKERRMQVSGSEKSVKSGISKGKVFYGDEAINAKKTLLGEGYKQKRITYEITRNLPGSGKQTWKTTVTALVSPDGKRAYKYEGSGNTASLTGSDKDFNAAWSRQNKKK